MAKKKKRKRAWRIFLGSLISAVVVMLGFTVYQWWLERQARFVRYAAFGIDIPLNYSIHGIDVSRYQETIDWESVKEMKVDNVQICFAFIKATEGNDDKDAYFKRNWKRAKEYNVTRGAYHFFLATKSGRKQAENFIENVTLEEGDLPPVLDVEHTYGVPREKLRQRVREWMSVIENHYCVKPILYTNVDFYEHYFKEEFDHYPLWVAHYLQPDKPRIYRDWHFWQYSEMGRVNGIFSRVDFNVFNGDSTAFRNLLVN
jgi:lysozyme